MVFKNKLIAYWTLLLLLFCFSPLISCSKVGLQTPVVIGINTWTGYDPFILAEQKKFFENNGVQVEIRRFASAQEEIQAMKDGYIHGAAFTLDEAVSLHMSGFPVRAVLVIDYSMGGDMIVGQKDVLDMQSISGKRIGYEGTVVGEFLLQRALKANYIKVSSVELIEVKAEDWLSSFRENTVDALVCFNPVSTILLNKHEGNLLFSSKDIPFEIIDILVFSESFLESNNTVVVNVVKTWFETLEYINSNIEEAAEVIASEKQISTTVYMDGLSGLVAPDMETNKAIFNMESEDNIYKYSQSIIDFMLSEGLLSGRVNTDAFFDTSILTELGK